VLDLGAHHGALSRALGSRPGIERVVAADSSFGFLAQRSGMRVGADPDLLPFHAGSFDLVASMLELHWAGDLPGALVQIRRILKPGGLFLIALPLEGQRGTIYPLLSRLGWDGKRRHSGHIQAFDNAGFRRLAGSVRLPVQRVRWSFHPLFALVDVLYYCWLDLRGPVGHSVEDMVADHPGRPALRGLKGVIASMGWYESRLLRRLVGACGHFTCIRTV